MIGAYVEPLDTYDMSHLKPREIWSSRFQAEHIAYFCGPMQEPSTAPLALFTKQLDVPNYDMDDVAKANAIYFLQNNIAHTLAERRRHVRALSDGTI